MDMEYQYLVAKLQNALAADTRVNALDIKVTVSAGRVHLTGQVPTAQRRAAVEQIAVETLPGLRVRNELTVLELDGATESEVVDD